MTLAQGGYLNALSDLIDCFIYANEREQLNENCQLMELYYNSENAMKFSWNVLTLKVTLTLTSTETEVAT